MCDPTDEATLYVNGKKAGAVKGGCSLLGLDPLYLANEGKFICILPESQAEAALALMHANPLAVDAKRIGTVTAGQRSPARNPESRHTVTSWSQRFGAGMAPPVSRTCRMSKRTGAAVDSPVRFGFPSPSAFPAQTPIV